MGVNIKSRIVMAAMAVVMGLGRSKKVYVKD